MTYKYCKDCRHRSSFLNTCNVTGYTCSVERMSKFNHVSDCGYEGRLWQPNLRYRFFKWLKGSKE